MTQKKRMENSREIWIREQCKIIGKVFAEMRQDQGISQEELAENLLTGRAISNFELNGEMPCWIVLRVMLQRLGKNADYFVPMLDAKEYEYLSWREEMLRRIRNHTVTENDWQTRWALDRSSHPVLQKQFVDFWSGYLTEDTCQMERAIGLTITGYPGNIPEHACIGTNEWLCVLICMEKKLSRNPECWREEEKVLKRILYDMENGYQEDERVKIYGKAVCLYGTYMPEDRAHEKLLLYHEALELQRQMANLSGLEDILRGIIRESERLGITDIQEYRDYLWTLEEIKREYHIPAQSLAGEQTEQEYYLLSEVLSAYRKERQMRVRQIGEDVCSEKTYRALENGKRGANKSTWYLLADYMDIPFGIYNTEILTDKYADLVLVDEIRRAAQRQDREERLRLLEELEQSLGEACEIPQNRQYIDSVRDWELFFAGEISVEEFQKRVERALQRTIPGWMPDYGTHFYTRREMTLVYYETVIYRRMGQPQKGIRLLEKMWNQIESSKVDNIYRIHEALLIVTWWKDLLTDIGEYEEALKKAEEGIRLCFLSGHGDALDTCILEPGWILERQHTDMSEEEKKIKCFAYFKKALYLSRLFYCKASYQAIKEYCEKRYNDENGFIC